MASTNPDTILREWISVVEDTGAPALNMVDSEGRLYAKKCGECASKTRHYSSMRHIWVCGQCGYAWDYRDGFLLKGAVQRSRKAGGHENWLLSTRIDYGILLDGWYNEPQWSWEVLIYAGYCVGMSPDDITKEMTMEFPQAPGPWGRASIYRRVQRARSEFIRRLTAREMLNLSPA